MLEPYGVETARFRSHLDALERDHVVAHGYGTLNFTRSLLAAFERFLPPHGDGALGTELRARALGILEHPLELLPGVEETLAYLASRHTLFLVTKGQQDEQSRKIEASGLAGYFRGVEILPEKHPESYRRLVEHHGWEPPQTWMIGNSLRSDIRPALAVGLNAVFIPHAHTWALEHDEPIEHPQLLELEQFSDLSQHF
jgi:putative hydrolase of the HAD superfamily